MALRRSKPIPWSIAGLSDAVSADLGFPGCMISLSNLVPDPGSKNLWQCRPAAYKLTDFTGFSNPGFISCFLEVGTRIYGLISTSRNAGRDEPFAYDIPTGQFITVSGVSSLNVPASSPSSGDWTPPVMALVGGLIIVTHPGFSASSYYFGTLNINNPANPVWSGANLTGAVTLPSPPKGVVLFSTRAYYFVENALVFSDTNNPINCTSGNQVITLGTNQSIVAVIGAPLVNQVQGGIVQSLTVFTSSYTVYQLTGDAALNNLNLNQLQVETGTYTQNSACSTPQGICFVSPEGIRFVTPAGLITDPIGVGGQGLTRIFEYVATPSRISVAYAGDAIRFNILNNYSVGTVLYEFMYHLSRKMWSGPHTFPASLVSGFGNSFIIAPIGIPGTLYRSNIVPTATDSYTENNARMSWQAVTPLLPRSEDMAMHEVIEQTIDLATSASDDYTFSFVDEQNNEIASTVLEHTIESSLWGTAIWGQSVGGSPNIGYSTFQLAYNEPVVFKRAFFAASGPSSSVFRLGTLSTRLRELGYTSPIPSINYSKSSGATYTPGPGYNPASPGYGVGPGYVYGKGYQSGITYGLGSVPSTAVPVISTPTVQASGNIQAVTMIPAATEWGYAPYEVLRDIDSTGVEFVATGNAYSVYGATQVAVSFADASSSGRIGGPVCDWFNSLNSLQYSLPSVGIVNLYVAWYGNDLRALNCTLAPGVTSHYASGFSEYPANWEVAGIVRNSAYVISTYNGGVAYGGTPSDDSVVAAIKDMHKRGLKVAFTPFILMDIPSSNTLPSTTAATGYQPVYPWRGRITKQYATSDKTPQVATEVAAFFAQYEAMVLHYATLCASAGGVEVFLIGTELRGLTWLRSAEGVHPFVNNLVSLAAAVKAILPAAQLTYGADWTEWFGFQPSDGSGDVDFHLDPLWANSNISAIGIDNYFPLSDWRDSLPNVDGLNYASIDNISYLQSNIQGGEDYDWYYANSTARTNQARTQITDGAYNKPWVFRPKDMWSWWQNLHYNRPAGVESGTPTSWLPQTKPIWFTEFGIPSVNKGTNQPNVFYAPQSSESAFPYFSTGAADNTIQAAGIKAVISYFNQEANNPISISYVGPMVDPTRIFVYTWDARPYPAFPAFTTIWSDGGDYPFDQWIQGKSI